MSTLSLTGQDALTVDGRVIRDLADGDSVLVEFPDELAQLKVAKNGNVIFAKDEKGNRLQMTLRLILNSSDDKYLNSRLQEMENNFSSFGLLTTSFSKRSGDGQGNVSTKVYQCSAGIFRKNPGAKTSAEGDTEQSVAIYQIDLRLDSVSIQ